jgi:hypothetical protein
LFPVYAEDLRLQDDQEELCYGKDKEMYRINRIERILMKKTVPAYLTVESSMILPGLIILLALIILLGLHLYDHCVADQSLYIAALRGSQLKNVKDSSVSEYTEKELNKLLENLIWEEDCSSGVRVGALSLRTYVNQKTGNPYKGQQEYYTEDFEINRDASAVRTDPVTFIRLKNTVAGIGDNRDSYIEAPANARGKDEYGDDQ